MFDDVLWVFFFVPNISSGITSILILSNYYSKITQVIHFSHFTTLLLLLSVSKTDVLFTLSGPSTSNASNISSSLGGRPNHGKRPQNEIVIFESELSFDTQMTKELQSCFTQLRQLSKVKLFLYPVDLDKVTHAFMSSRLDYCNALNSGNSK